jgi:Tfp pilus assembly protein PilO
MGLRGWIGFFVILAICALLIVGNATVYGPARTKLHELNSAFAVSRNEVAYLKSNPEQFELIASYLPERLEGSEGGEQVLISKISEIVKNAGMVMTDVQPGKVTQDGSYKRRQFKLDVKGDYREFARLMRSLETMPEIVIVESFDLLSGSLGGEREHSARITVTIIGY